MTAATAGDIFYDTPITGEIAEEAKAEDQAKAESEAKPESEVDAELNDGQEAETETAEDDGEDIAYVLELDGKEYDLNDVRKWRDGHMLPAKYAQKATELDKRLKETIAERDKFSEHRQALEVQLADLKAVIELEDQTDWQRLRDSDPEEYIERKELHDKRKALAEKYKSQTVARPEITQEEVASEQNALFTGHPEWVSEGNFTDAYKTDMQLLGNYWSKSGFTETEIQGMARARYIETSLKAAKYDALMEKSKETTKQIRKAPVVTKPGTSSKSVEKPRDIADVLYDKS
jgi:hypothetical protein